MSVPDFAIGSSTWPGLAKLAEECGELVQVIGKLFATGGAAEHWDGTNLHQRLSEELADVRASMNFVAKFNADVDSNLVSTRALDKLFLFQRWHREQLDDTVKS